MGNDNEGNAFEAKVTRLQGKPRDSMRGRIELFPYENWTLFLEEDQRIPGRASVVYKHTTTFRLAEIPEADINELRGVIEDLRSALSELLGIAPIMPKIDPRDEAIHIERMNLIPSYEEGSPSRELPKDLPKGIKELIAGYHASEGRLP